jgi:hypothetical protein
VDGRLHRHGMTGVPDGAPGAHDQADVESLSHAPSKHSAALWRPWTTMMSTLLFIRTRGAIVESMTGVAAPTPKSALLPRFHAQPFGT